MPNRPHPQAFEQAFLFGESVVLLFYHAEHRWFYVSDLAPPIPDLVDTRIGQVRDLIERLRRIFHSRSRARLCDRFIGMLDEAWCQYCSAWDSETHRDAINAFNGDYSESTINVYPVLLQQAPVTGETWTILKNAAESFVDKLPPALRRLAQIGELISTGLWWSGAYPIQQQGQRRSDRRLLTVDFNGQLNAKMRELRRAFPLARNLTCDLFGLDSKEAISRLDQFRSQILVATQQHGAELEAPRRVSETRPTQPHLPAAHVLAWQSFQLAIRRMAEAGTKPKRTKHAAWTWLNENRFFSSYQPPSLESFSRFVRGAEQFYRQHPDQRPSDGRGVSIVPYSQADINA